ncbi:hypothetical protein [Paraburkholderia terricola]|jgi:hypothetical protein|uniref:Uncharacterized protein n=1 Tax=Paraburkholderia terricola TaxID=169427 RepID=A0A1M6LHE1_9BURK|nr:MULTISPECIES: hypothetical protein [Paraburkholderia]SDN86675.1 hypothetical protein SAMN05192547_1005118 [Paraburkholderia sediminicola]SHJ70632.1 hypothetical protein SAMN05192548_1005119 [Paraburkholderia terricola]
MKDDTTKAGIIGRPMGMPRKVLEQMGKTNPAAKAVSALMNGSTSLDEKRRIVRRMQMDNLNNEK